MNSQPTVASPAVESEELGPGPDARALGPGSAGAVGWGPSPTFVLESAPGLPGASAPSPASVFGVGPGWLGASASGPGASASGPGASGRRFSCQGLVLSVGSATHPGRCRSINEDAVWAAAPVFVVADGMGGHDAGDRASSIAVGELGLLPVGCRVQDVRGALNRARSGIDRLTVRGGRRAAGTTVSGLILVEEAGEPYWLVVNVGDSRTYHVVAGQVSQVSVDHSEVQELIASGRLDPAAAGGHSRRHVITRALGAHTPERPDYWLMPARAEERWLVCSDGLTGELDDHRIAEILASGRAAQETVDQLVREALAAGGRDNVSVIVVDVAGQDDDPDDPTVEIWPTVGTVGGSGKADGDAAVGVGPVGGAETDGSPAVGHGPAGGRGADTVRDSAVGSSPAVPEAADRPPRGLS